VKSTSTDICTPLAASLENLPEQDLQLYDSIESLSNVFGALNMNNQMQELKEQ
jgi:hypothetical protein